MIAFLAAALVMTTAQENASSPEDIRAECRAMTSGRPYTEAAERCRQAREQLLDQATNEAVRLWTLYTARRPGDDIRPSMPEIQADWFARAEQGTPHYDHDRILGCESLWNRGERMVQASAAQTEGPDQEAASADIQDLARTYVLMCGARP